jgi:predicted 2-oxoglutarate/Fe(II)-dependent dioxygenase YbiX/peroxiredoxin
MPSSLLQPGDPAPWFTAASSNNPKFAFDTVAGRYVVLAFLGSSAVDQARRALDAVHAHRELLDDEKISFFGVTADRRDRDEGRCQQVVPGIRYFWDFDLALAKRFGAVERDAAPGAGGVTYRAHWLVLDPFLRVLATIPFDADGRHAERVIALLRGLPPVDLHAGPEVTAPVLILPRVFEPELCRHLIDYYEAHGGGESGFMRDVDGKTVGIVDHAHKQRFDCAIEDEALRLETRTRLERRLVPELRRCFQYVATRIERYIVACYDAASGGHFNAHRDNTTFGTAHRRFACSINLNVEEYEGGDLSFPEFGSRRYRPPTGGVCVFSCSLLHRAWPVTRGKRYVFLPFIYDEAAARIRERNNARLGESVRRYGVGSAVAPAAE